MPISIVIPALNQDRYLEATIRSVLSPIVAKYYMRKMLAPVPNGRRHAILKKNPKVGRLLIPSS
jgi:hypothetical protein